MVKINRAIVTPLILNVCVVYSKSGLITAIGFDLRSDLQMSPLKGWVA